MSSFYVLHHNDGQVVIRTAEDMVPEDRSRNTSMKAADMEPRSDKFDYALDEIQVAMGLLYSSVSACQEAICDFRSSLGTTIISGRPISMKPEVAVAKAETSVEAKVGRKAHVSEKLSRHRRPQLQNAIVENMAAVTSNMAHLTSRLATLVITEQDHVDDTAQRVAPPIHSTSTRDAQREVDFTRKSAEDTVPLRGEIHGHARERNRRDIDAMIGRGGQDTLIIELRRQMKVLNDRLKKVEAVMLSGAVLDLQSAEEEGAGAANIGTEDATMPLGPGQVEERVEQSKMVDTTQGPDMRLGGTVELATPESSFCDSAKQGADIYPDQGGREARLVDINELKLKEEVRALQKIVAGTLSTDGLAVSPPRSNIDWKTSQDTRTYLEDGSGDVQQVGTKGRGVDLTGTTTNCENRLHDTLSELPQLQSSLAQLTSRVQAMGKGTVAGMHSRASSINNVVQEHATKLVASALHTVGDIQDNVKSLEGASSHTKGNVEVADLEKVREDIGNVTKYVKEVSSQLEWKADVERLEKVQEKITATSRAAKEAAGAAEGVNAEVNLVKSQVEKIQGMVATVDGTVKHLMVRMEGLEVKDAKSEYGTVKESIMDVTRKKAELEERVKKPTTAARGMTSSIAADRVRRSLNDVSDIAQNANQSATTLQDRISRVSSDIDLVKRQVLENEGDVMTVTETLKAVDVAVHNAAREFRKIGLKSLVSARSGL
ncbi:hypothetical protein BXZ70DRAFT_933506, partial [Cristinia sonorae]